jgi:hypothetical protein
MAVKKQIRADYHSRNIEHDGSYADFGVFIEHFGDSRVDFEEKVQMITLNLSS